MFVFFSFFFKMYFHLFFFFLPFFSHYTPVHVPFFSTLVHDPFDLWSFALNRTPKVKEAEYGSHPPQFQIECIKLFKIPYNGPTTFPAWARHKIKGRRKGIKAHVTEKGGQFCHFLPKNRWVLLSLSVSFQPSETMRAKLVFRLDAQLYEVGGGLRHGQSRATRRGSCPPARDSWLFFSAEAFTLRVQIGSHQTRLYRVGSRNGGPKLLPSTCYRPGIRTRKVPTNLTRLICPDPLLTQTSGYI